MDEIALLEKTYKVIEDIEKEGAKDGIQKETLFKECFKSFIDFYDDIDTLMILYQYKKLKDENQCMFADKFFFIIKWIVQNRELFLKDENYGHIADTILQKYCYREKYHAFNLMMNGSIDEINSERDHFTKRAELEQVLKSANSLSNTQKQYLNEHTSYYKYFFGHALPYLDTHFTEVPEEEIFRIIKEIEDTNIIEDIINAKNDKLSFEDSNLVFQYITFVLKMKSIFKPQEIYNDSIIQAFWSGKIKNRQIIDYLFSQYNNEEILKRQKIKVGQIFDYDEVLKQLLLQDGWNRKNFFANLIMHFQKVGIPMENINRILGYLIPIIETYDAAEFILDVKKYPEICNKYIVELLNNKVKTINEGETIDIPFRYALESIPNMSEEMTENLITLLHSEYYTEEEKRKLWEKLKECKIIDENRIQTEPIIFEETDSVEKMLEKVKLAYYNRQVIPYEIAKKILKLHYQNSIKMNSKLLKPCIVSIISNTLKQQGIEINSNVFFGKSEKKRGTYYRSKNFKGVWINDSLIDDYCNSDSKKVFVTSAHEMRHANQFYKLEKGDIDFLTYNFIIEQVIREYDPDFYEFNYKKMFIEEDARQFGIIDEIKLLEDLDIWTDKELSEFYKELKEELINANLYKDSEKDNPFRTGEKINISDYLGRMIRHNPAILNRFHGILKLGYNLAGTLKRIETLLKEYRALGEMDNKRHRNLYSIYYGLINKQINKDLQLPEEIEADLTEFKKEKHELISVVNMRHYFKTSAPPAMDIIAKKIFAMLGMDDKAEKIIA